jgi:hypothetical protein
MAEQWDNLLQQILQQEQVHEQMMPTGKLRTFLEKLAVWQALLQITFLFRTIE